VPLNFVIFLVFNLNFGFSVGVQIKERVQSLVLLRYICVWVAEWLGGWSPGLTLCVLLSIMDLGSVASSRLGVWLVAHVMQVQCSIDNLCLCCYSSYSDSFVQ
jgi:hypothetical protein